jgi:dihydrofolate reductase
MTSIYADMSLSVDGFIAGPRVGADHPLGDGGEQLHDWMFAGRSAEESRAFEEERFAATGALIMGRTMLDVGVGPWGEDPTFHAPVFVVTHRAAEPIVKRGGTTYTFVTDGPDAALQRAREAAGQQEICLAGGAAIIQHYLTAGVIDELHLHLVPVLLGAGVRLFVPGGGPGSLTLRPGVTDDAGVVHLRYGLQKKRS